MKNYLISKESNLRQREIFNIEVNYQEKIEEILKKINYYFADSRINSKNFPVAENKNGKMDRVDLIIKRFNCLISSNDVLEIAKKQNIKTANIWELLNLMLLNEQRLSFPIVSLGSIIEEPDSIYCAVPMVKVIKNKELLLTSFDGDWGKEINFLFSV